MIRRIATRSLTLLAAWLLYACGNAPTAPPIGAEAEQSATADPVASTDAEPNSGIEAPNVPAELSVDPLVRWALDPVEAADHDARIARAILQLTDEWKE